MNTHQLKWLATKFSKRHNKWFAALEQSGLSACNFFYSLLILKFAGVTELGTYTFWFVVCQFMAMLTMGLATRQMVLQFSNEPSYEQHQGFWATCRIVAMLQVLQVLLLVALVWAYPPSGNALTLLLALVLYSVSFNFAELVRQFYYLSSRQRQSLWFSALSLSLGAFGFCLFAIYQGNQTPALYAFWFLATGNVVYVFLTLRAVRIRSAINARVSMRTLDVCRSYWKPGIPATGGMLVTWMQNQSVTPLLMFMLGPLAVGYYSVARMIVTPVNMVTTGLAKSALPQIRRAFGAGNDDSLDKAVRSHCRTSMRIVFGYVALVVVGWMLSRALGWIKSGDMLVPLFVATVIVMILSNYRFWISQNFVVRMQFGTLLKLGIVASSLTVILMLIGGLVFKSAMWVVLAPAVGELCLILTLSRRLGRTRGE